MSKKLAADDLTLPIKRTDGETIQERLTGNAYHNILPARYLRKNSNGELAEQQEELFERVARNIALAEAVFEADKREVEVTVRPDQLKPDHPRRDELAAEVFGKGVTVDDDVERPLTEHNVNKFAYETVVPELPAEIREHVETTAGEFQEAMEMLSFMPNCVPPDSLVAAGGGLKPISDVEPGERVYDDEDGTARVESKYDNGQKRVLEVETTSGYTVRATPEHYFRVITADGHYEWRQLKSIEPADTLAVQKNFLDDDGEPQPLDWQPTTTDGGTVQVGRSRGSFQPPAAMTSDLAEWLGLYIGDGTARDSGVRVAFDESDPDLLGYWVELTESVFGFEPTTGQHHDDACLLGRASRRDLSDFLEQNDLLKANSRTATVPASVLRSGRSSVAAFLRGLFEADGTVGERQIELYTHSEGLGRQVQKLLLGLGIRSRLSEKRDGYRLSVRKNVCGKRFVKQVGFLSERKRERAKRFMDVADNATSVKIPNQGERLHEWFQESDLGLDAYRELSQFLIDPDSEHHQEIGKGIFEQYAEQYPELWNSPVADLAARDQFYERVERVSTVGTMAVEDMQVPRRNTYVVEGFVSHNSPTLMNAGDELQQLSACIAGHAPVYTRDGLKRMDQIEPGDNVLTHEGRFKPVVDHWSNGEKSTVEMRRGIDRGSSFDTQLTPDHEVYTDDGNWVRADTIGNPADPVFPSDTEFPERIGVDQYTDRLNKNKDVVVDGGQVKLRNADDPRTPEFDQQNNQPAAEINNDRTLGWLFGLYLAEGDVYGSDLRFTVGTDETELRERLISSLKQTFNLPVSISESSHGQWVQIRLSSPFVADLFATVLGVGGDQKRIPEWVGAAGESYQQALLDGLLDGDGTELETARRLVLANPTLVYEATLLARSLGYEAVFKLKKERDISSGPTSECYISTAENPRLSNVARHKAETVEVYDMEVADDHSFVVGDFIVHNCFVDSPEDDIDDIHQTAKEAAQVFQCLTADATVRVEGKGMVSVSEVEVGDRVVQQTDSGFQHRPVEETHAYEDAETLTVRLANGLTVRGTPNHRLMVDDSWTRLDEIQAGQEMHYALGWLREAETDPPELASVASGGRWGENRTVENAEIRELHREGLSDYEIAERLDCGKSTVQRRRSHELGLSPNGDGGRNPGATSFDERAALDLYRDGHTDSEVADQLGVHPTTVSQFRAREQLDPNGKPAKTVRQPEHLDETLAELVGLWVGDGSWHQDGVRFHVKRESIAEYIDQLSRQLFGTSASISFADGCYEVIINSHEIRRWWDSNFDCKPDGARSARVPRVVKAAPANVVESFLRGYFTADGTLLDGTYPKLYSSSERAIDDVASLMMGLGYPVKKSVIRDEDAHPYFGVVPTTGTGRKAFLRDVGFIDERRETALSNIESVAARDSYVIGDEYTVEVDAVVESDPATVYDITVEDNHEYVADGIVSHNSGGGMGYAFWRLRPYGDAVGSTGGIASGPVTFMRTYDQMCETIAQGGARRGAQMGVMRVSHPDVIQFIHAKNKDVSLANTLRLNDPDDFTHTSFADALEEARELIDDDGRVPEHLRNAVEGHLSNFNISVGVTDGFMDAVKNNEAYTFTNPRTEEPHVATGETVELYEMFGLGEYVEAGEVLSVPARELWNHIVEGAHENGEPGVVYLERINDEHSFDIDEHPDHRILATNPCVTGDTLISTEDGLITAEELYEQGVARDIVVDGRLSEERVKEASSVYRTGEKEVHRLTTKEGYELRLTADHRVMTDDGWVAAENLDAGDTVHIQNRKGEFGQHGSAAEGRVLGWLVGDGHLKNGEERAVLNFYDEDTEISDQFAKDVNEIVRDPLGNANYEVGVSDISRSDNYRGPQAVEQRIRSVRLYEYAEQAGLAKDKLQVPEAVVRGSEEMARGFLQALFTADGHVEGTPESGFSVRLTSIDPDLLRNVQRLLANFGIRSQIYQDRKSGGTKQLPDGHGGTAEYETTSSHQLAISSTHLIAFEEEIGFLLDEKQEQLSDTLDEYGRGPYVGRFEATVESVEHDGTEQVYDLTEPDTQSFIANGLIVHNCGEQPLEEYEACNLGHINLSTLAAEDAPDWRVWSERHAEEYATQDEAVEAFLEAAIDFEEFDRRIELGTRFLENVVTMSDFPVEEIEQTVREMRKIGLGIMGLAQLNIQLGTKYGSETANEIARQLMIHINHQSKQTSHNLATERGVFAEWDDSKYAAPTEYREWFERQTGEDADEWADGFPMRNHNTTTIAPTGTTSMLGNTTGGCEPIYNVAYYKNVSDDVQGDEMLVEFDDYFLRVLEDNGIDVEAVKEEAKRQMAENGFDGVEGLSTVPDAIGELFVTTGDLSAKQHASVQTSCQQGVDSAISKTVNAPNDSTVADAKEVFEYIYDHGGKGVTYYRDGTRSKQVLTTRAQNTEFAEMDEAEAIDFILEKIDELFGGIEGFLENEEIRGRLSADIEELLAEETRRYAQKKPRPDQLHGVTQRIDTGYGKLYVTINEDPESGEPFELFANTGHSGGFTNSFTDALAKTISVALRSGVDPYEIVDKLQGIRSPKVAWDKGEQINSIPDAFGTALRRYLDDDIDMSYPDQATLEETASDGESREESIRTGPEPETDGAGTATRDAAGIESDHQSVVDAGENPECPECGSLSLYYSEGCKTCESCGWSEC